MWIVKNRLKATLSFRGLDLSIPSGEQFDLDVLGREHAEGSNQVQVAFEEGYLENVYKAPGRGAPTNDETDFGIQTSGGVSAEHFDARLEDFKKEFLSELRGQLPLIAERSHLEEVRTSIGQDVQELVGEFKLLRDRLVSMKGRIQEDGNLSDAEVRARLAFLEEQERELMKNFETIGRQVEQEDGDVMDKADLLANL